MLLRQGLRGPTAEKTRQTIVFCAIDQYTAEPPSFTLFLFQKTLNNPDMLTTKSESLLNSGIYVVQMN